MEDRFDMLSELIVQQGGQRVTRSENTPAENLQKAIHARASFLTRRNIPNYNRLPNLIDSLRAFFLSNFPGFSTAIVTSQANIMKTGMVENNLAVSRDPSVDLGLRLRLLRRAAMRGVSNLTWLVGPGTYMAAASALRFATKTKTGLGITTGATATLAPFALSRFVPDWAVNNNFIFVSDSDEEGEFDVYDFTYTDGYTLISEPSRLLLKYLATERYLGPEASEKVFDQFQQSVKNVSSSFTDEKIMVRAIREFISGTNAESRSLGPYTEEYTEYPIWHPLGAKDRFERLYETLAPKVIHEGVELGKATKSAFGRLLGGKFSPGEESLDERGRERNLINALQRTFGYKKDAIKPKQVFKDYKVYRFDNELDYDHKWATRVFYRAKGDELDYDNMPAIVAAYDGLQKKHFERVKDLRLDIHWMAPILGTSA